MVSRWARRARALSQAVLFAGVVGGLVGCRAAWHSKTSPFDVIAARPERVRVTAVSGDRHVLEATRISADSLIGFETLKGGQGRRVALTLDEVARIEVREPDVAKTALYWGAQGALLLTLILLSPS